MVGELDRGGDTFLDHPYANTFKALQVATAALDPGLAVAYGSLAVYPPDIRIPVAAVARYWGQLRGSSPGPVHTDLQMLADRELLILDRDEIAFHDLQHSYLLLQADNLALLHADLLAGYQALLPAAGTGWWRLPADEPYIWDHLLHHLHGAGDRAGAASTLTDLAYLARRIALAGPHAAETELTQASVVLPDDPRIGWLRRWLAQHAHLFAGLADLADVAVTLAGWLAPACRDRPPPAGTAAAFAVSRAPVGPARDTRLAPRPDWPHLRGVRGGVQPGRAAARLRRQGRDGAAVGSGHRRRAGHPDRPRRRGCTRWRSARTGGSSPPPAGTGRCGCGIRPPAPRRPP